MQSRPDLRKHNHDSSYAQINHKHDDPSPSGNRSVYTRPSRQIISGAGLTGGGDLTADRTLAVGAGTGLSVNADDVALSAGSIASLALADSAVQPARQVISGDGLTGGGDLSNDRTLAVGAGTGVQVNADDVALDTAHARNVDHSAVSVLAGAGLTGGGTIEADRTLAVGAGTGIDVNADDVTLNAATIASLLLADTAVQPADLHAVATSGDYDDLENAPVLETGTFTPTATAITNIDDVGTPLLAMYVRIGSFVFASGIVLNVDPTAAGSTEFTLSLPIASDLAAQQDLVGGCSNRASPDAGAVEGSAADNVARVRWSSGSGGARPINYWFLYQIK